MFIECRRPTGPKWWHVAATVTVAASMMVSGCAQNQDTSGPATNTTAVAAGKVESIANTVPADIKNSGTLIVGVNVPYAPMDYKDPSGKIIGFDVDLMNAIATTLGLTPDYREAEFAKIIPSVQGNTFNIGMSSFTVTKEREKSVDFVTYFSAGTMWAQRSGTPVDPNNACGRKVAVQATTVQETDELPAKSKACTDGGKPAIDILKFDGQDQATNAVVLGQADAMSADSPVTGYAIKQTNGKLEQAGGIFDSAPYGWAVAKGSPLTQSMAQALQHLMDTGAYKQIASNWGIEQGVIDKPAVTGSGG